MSNTTLLEDVTSERDTFPVPSTSINSTEPFPVPSTSLENTTLLQDINSTTPDPHHPFEAPELARFIDRNPWVVYVAVGALSICVFLIVFLLLKNLCRKKKQVIQQNDDPVLSSTYDDGTENILYRIFCCRRKQQVNMGARQNSESNLDPYKRPPLPPIGIKQEDFHYISQFASNGLDPEEKHHAAYINAIRGVAHLPQRSEQYRALPPLRLDLLNEKSTFKKFKK